MSTTDPDKPIQRTFLSAEWRWLAMLNWEIDPAILQPCVPSGTELDFYDGKTFVSIVGFMFLRTKLLGIPIPCHRNFEELNLRFYVRRNETNEVRRGVVFIRELVPKWAIATIARLGYNENYQAAPMRHNIRGGDNDQPVEVDYQWKFGGQWQHLRTRGQAPAAPLVEGSLEQFIAEHYWGYSRQRNGTTFEYQVRHPAWKIWQCNDVEFVCNVEELYGTEFSPRLSQSPDSTFIADGSAVSVSFPRRLKS